MCAVIEYYTYDDYVNWEGDWELIDGVAYAMSPSPLRSHQGIASEFVRHLGNEVKECLRCEVLSEFDYRIADDTVVRPDVVLVCDETNENYLTKAPEIVVEVVSKSSAKRDEKRKFKLYEQEGVKYYILAYPNDLVAKVFRLKDGRFIKVGNFTKESLEFDGLICDIKIDFNEVFQRYFK